MSKQNPIVIEVKQVTKKFNYWKDPNQTFKKFLIDLTRGKLPAPRKDKFTVLDRVSFDIRAGEFVGIMGRNGAGKSTLLKLITSIYRPTEGEVNVYQSIAPLIELGAGFHMDLSGYENIFLNAAILGFGKKVTQQALPEILAFSELGDQIHMPVKHYSSGMLVRLGFSIAVHLSAPIILMDEVLAVGDAGFQAKCLNKIHSLHQEGRTIVLITHNPDAVRYHCTRCIVIDHHQKVYDGPAPEGVDIYLKSVQTPS